MNYYGISAFLFGAVFGGFLGVFIHRHTEGKPITTLRSICRMCGHPIKIYDLIPILIYFILRGRCRDCGRPISHRYAVIEALTGLLTLALLKYGFPLSFAAGLFCVALIAIAYIDLNHRIVPDGINLPGIPICFLAAVFILKMNRIDSLPGMLAAGGGVLFSLILIKKTMKYALPYGSFFIDRGIDDIFWGCCAPDILLPP